MNKEQIIKQLPKEDQRYYYYGKIELLADELGEFDYYSEWLRLHRSVKTLKAISDMLEMELNKLGVYK